MPAEVLAALPPKALAAYARDLGLEALSEALEQHASKNANAELLQRHQAAGSAAGTCTAPPDTASAAAASNPPRPPKYYVTVKPTSLTLIAVQKVLNLSGYVQTHEISEADLVW